jgi:hypothetical protein
MWTDEYQPLSPQGERRREQLLVVARAAARAHRQKRHQRLVILATISGLMVPLVTALVLQYRRQPVSVAHYTPQPSSPPQPPSVIIAPIETDADITARLALPATPARWRWVGDDELLQTLADAGRPAGLVRINGQSLLLLR